MSEIFLGVDTSNYTTSLALYSDGKIIKHTRRLLPVRENEAGLRQSDAVFLHTKALPELARELFSCTEYDVKKLRAVGVSSRPRDIKESYMPCFLAGVSFASGIANALDIPVFEFSHQAGHIKSGVFSSGCNEIEKDTFVSFHVSGGTTEALLVKKCDGTYKVEIIGGTNDVHAGQIIDRAGVYSGLMFPCGKALDELSKNADKKLPVCVSVKDTYFSLSGLQNKYVSFIESGESIQNASRFIFESISESIRICTENIRKKYSENIPVLYAGGVMCNSVIRENLARLKNTYFASAELSCDNACGIAILCGEKYKNSEEY